MQILKKWFGSFPMSEIHRRAVQNARVLIQFPCLLGVQPEWNLGAVDLKVQYISGEEEVIADRVSHELSAKLSSGTYECRGMWVYAVNDFRNPTYVAVTRVQRIEAADWCWADGCLRAGDKGNFAQHIQTIIIETERDKFVLYHQKSKSVDVLHRMVRELAQINRAAGTWRDSR
jgi:hypothetical protein